MYVDKIMSLMNDEDREAYKDIFAPRTVAIPPEDARRSMCICADGEIRVYGLDHRKSAFSEAGARRVYLSSRNGGLSFEFHVAAENDIGECVYVPWMRRFAAVSVRMINGKRTICALLSDIGPGDASPLILPITEENYIDIFLPLVIEEKKRLIVTAHRRNADGDYVPAVMISDNGGESWSIRELKSCPRYPLRWPDRHLRWNNNGSEPSIVKLSNGRLWLLLRTSDDYMYEAFSDDFGDSFTEAAPSRFHMTLTTPYALTLNDGRSVLFWNNTRPMPELDIANEFDCNDTDLLDGVWEDVFTNRDASHAAISEDCLESFVGFRETALSAVRNRADFRTCGDIVESADRSVHQHQAIELPYNKILLHVGQNPLSRKLIIFDVNWLYEKQRSEDFHSGLENVSVHGYRRGPLGSHVGEGIPGHCQFNRYVSVANVTDPADNRRECVSFLRVHDPRNLNDLSGLTWNFPALKKGCIKLELYHKGGGLRISLADHFINPTDPTAREFAAFTVEADRINCPDERWYLLGIRFDTELGKATVFADGRPFGTLNIKRAAPFGLSYVHLQSAASDVDYEGSFLRSILAEEDRG